MHTTDAIRPLRTDDRAAWEPLWAGYLAFYRETLAPEVTDATFRRLCAEEDGMFGLVAVGDGGELVGFVHAIVHPSTWTTASYTYLEDLFVAPGGRGRDVGGALIEATADAARARGSSRVYWQTQEYNGRARSLYDHVGQLTSFIVYERPLS